MGKYLGALQESNGRSALILASHRFPGLETGLKCKVWNRHLARPQGVNRSPVKLLGSAERNIKEIVCFVILSGSDFEIKTCEGKDGSRDREILPAPEAP